MPVLSPAPDTFIYSSKSPTLSLLRTSGSGEDTYIGGVRYGNVKPNSWTIQQNSSLGKTASFVLDLRSGILPIPGMQVARFVDGTKRFGGIVSSVKRESKPNSSGFSDVTVNCTGFQGLASRIILARLYTLQSLISGVPSIVIQDIVDKCLAQFGTIYVPEGNPADLLPDTLIHYRYAKEALDQIVALTPGWSWWIDDGNILHYKLRDSLAGATADAPFVLTRAFGSAQSAGQLSDTTSADQFANRVYVVPVVDSAALRTDEITADGINYVFPLTYPILSGQVKVTLNGTELKVTEGGNWISGWQAYFVKGVSSIFLASVPSLGALLEISYPSPFPLASVSEDLDSIADVGPYDRVFFSKTARTMEEAQAEGDRLLAALSRGGVFPGQIDYSYNSAQQREWLTVGMIQTVDWIEPDISDDYNVESVSSSEAGGTLWNHKVTLRNVLAALGTQAGEEAIARGALRVPISSPPRRKTLELDIDGVGNQVGVLPGKEDTFQEDSVLTFWEALPNAANPPIGADMIIDVFLDGVSIFPAGSPASNDKKIIFRDGVTTLQSGIEFREQNLVARKGQKLTFEILQVGSTNPSKYGKVYIGYKPVPATH